MRLYVTNIVTSWNEEKNRQTVNLYGRTEDGKQELIEVHGFDDYFYADSDEIKEELEHYYEKEIHHGRLYPNLDTLVEKGLVKKGQRDQRTNFYTLTQRGRREIEARREWENEYIEETLLSA